MPIVISHYQQLVGGEVLQKNQVNNQLNKPKKKDARISTLKNN